MSRYTGLTTRRTFLGLTVTLAGGTVAGSALNPVNETPDDQPPQAADTYRETDHIRTAYKRMRF
ncbi:twin-arginine translocation signal domain-containing protein [Roseibium salinum]|uniref:Twin-arginine translocation signal domain-containing protein n=1 Tax=Roseibium salinum TaxID=1604349 RepID=A0ABT3R0J1_9HYPH|nr:twin-arginine translocation signal domain-containing protein [Roseibium sp. DSM 29163]MCX2722687.1 twin-arginine translocation signal domain-containing protein [Roseibium sp. DSM 29163]